VGIAQGARFAQVEWVIERHAGGGLHQRLQNERGDMSGTHLEQRAQFVDGAARNVGGGFARLRLLRIGRHDLMRAHEERVVGIAEDGHIGDSECA